MTEQEAREFVLRRTRPLAPALVPELEMQTADELTPLWQETEDTLRRRGVEPPYWAFAWPGCQALARWFLDGPSLAGTSVLDLGAGSGLAAIAAAKRGARVTANDVDPLAIAACRINAERAGVEIETRLGDLTTGPPLVFDLVIVGDVCYDRTVSARLMAWVRTLPGRVVLAEPGRAFRPRDGVRTIGRYAVPTSREIEAEDEREVVLLEVTP